MKIWSRIILFALVTVLLMATVSPALAYSEVTLTILNLGQSKTTLILRGPMDLDIAIQRQITKVRVEPGNYDYRYLGCGRTVSGTIQVGSHGATLKVLKCEKDLFGTVVITNLTGRTFELLLHGPKTYFLTIITGDHKYTVHAGRYEYRAFVCGAFRTGEKGLKAKNNADWVWSCK